MYADGDGVARDDPQGVQLFLRDHRAFFGRRSRSDMRSIVSTAFVSVGDIFAQSVASAKISPDPDRAFDLFRYAATFFRDADAEYQLGRMYLDGVRREERLRQGMNWLDLAARKGHAQAQALLGEMMFRRGGGARTAARADVSTLARESASGTPADQWIIDFTPRRWLRPAKPIAGPPSPCWRIICAIAIEALSAKV